jgi:hypothetical protein
MSRNTVIKVSVSLMGTAKNYILLQNHALACNCVGFHKKLGSGRTSFIPRNQDKTGPKGAEFSWDKKTST